VLCGSAVTRHPAGGAILLAAKAGVSQPLATAPAGYCYT